MAELETMMGRRSRCGHDCILPVRYSDGDHYPREYASLQWEDMTQHAYVSTHRRAPRALRVHVQRIAKLVGDRVRATLADPNWDPSWAFIEPSVPELPRLGRPRL